MTAGYEFWLFDLDGTLVDVEPAYIVEVIDQVGEAIEYPFTDEQAISLWRALTGPPEHQLRSWGIDPDEFWTAFHEIEEPESRVDATFLYSDAADVADLDCPVGLVTHCQSYITGPVLDALDIRDWFDTVVCCHDGIGWKPDPRPVERAIDDLGISDGDGALAGDSAADVGAAWNAGLDGIHVERADPTDRGMCVRADSRITTFEDVFRTSPGTARQVSE